MLMLSVQANILITQERTACLTDFELSIYQLPEAAALLRIIEGTQPERQNRQLEAPTSDKLWDCVNTFWAQDSVSRPSAQSVIRNMDRLALVEHFKFFSEKIGEKVPS
jgi:hypothetical protein